MSAASPEEIAALADQIAAALRQDAAPTPAASAPCGCQRKLVALAACVGWGTARRLVMDRVRRGDPVEGRAAPWPATAS